MTEPPRARLCYITQPEPGTFVLNLQFDPDQPRVTDVTTSGSRFERVQISREQLANIIKDGVGGVGVKTKRITPSEHKLQVALMDYLRIAGRQDLHWFAVPNGGHRHIAEASRLKAEGVRSGTPDLCFMLPDGKVAWLEMKAAKGSLGPAQKEFRDIAARLGHHWGMAKTVDEALEHLTKWDALKPAYRKQSHLFKTNHLASIQLSKGENRGTQA